MQKARLLFSAVVFTALVIGTYAVCNAQVKSPDIKAEIEKALRAELNAAERFDGEAYAGAFADDGFSFSAGGFYTNADTNKQMKSAMEFASKGTARSKYEIKGLRVFSVSDDVAIAYWVLTTNDTDGSRSKTYDQTMTDTFVKRGGRWLIFAEHASGREKPAAEVVPGLPAGWIRTPRATGDRYSIGADTNIRHSGKASASIKFLCGNDSESWASLGQPIAADEYLGKRIRLSGWLRTSNADMASLWMRIDGERRRLGFDNMSNRGISGTNDWKEYSVVLDVPKDARNIFIGVLLLGNGQLWADDLKIETVDNTVASTNIDSPEDAQRDDPAYAAGKIPNSKNKRPVNLGFEDGTVQ